MNAVVPSWSRSSPIVTTATMMQQTCRAIHSTFWTVIE